MKITIKDVAERANVSPSTVSRVFTGVAKVSPDKREAVLKAADELSFTPNFMAEASNSITAILLGYCYQISVTRIILS